MANIHKAKILDELKARFGALNRLADSQSLFSIGDNAARVYFRYSKVHPGGRTFFGLRRVDLQQLEGHNSFLCFILDDNSPPLFIPYADFEETFRAAQPADDVWESNEPTIEIPTIERLQFGKLAIHQRNSFIAAPAQ